MRGRNASTTLSDPAVVRRGVWRCRVPPQNGNNFRVRVYAFTFPHVFHVAHN
jgi:hypothetical protein